MLAAARGRKDRGSVAQSAISNVNATNEDRSGLEMSLPANAENVAVVRHALAGLAESIGMDEPGIADLKTVVTEACMNVVVHAYPEGRAGALEVEAVPEPDGLMVAVRDHGTGIRPRTDTERSSLRLGLTLIAALSGSFEIKGGADRGTEIRMRLPLTSLEREDAEVPGSTVPGRPETTDLRVGPPQLLAPILSRALTSLAARHDVTVDRISDAMLLSDAISAGAPQGFPNGQVCLSILDGPEGVELKVGPMEEGGGDSLRQSLELPQVGGTLESLADELRVETDDEGEYLVVGIAALSERGR
jgi:anti-sigma regulatory factor (Ser/Thr protein kinase)